jgi:hypothetical protein
VLLHASPELQDFLPEFRFLQIGDVQAHHDLGCFAEPPAGRRARDPEIRGDGDVPGAVDEIPKPVVVALPKAPRRHGDDHPAFAYAAQLLEDIRAVRRRETVRRSDDNSRRKVQNVLGDSSAIRECTTWATSPRCEETSACEAVCTGAGTVSRCAISRGGSTSPPAEDSRASSLPDIAPGRQRFRAIRRRRRTAACSGW